MYEIRFCEKNEIEELQLYIKENVSSTDILATDLNFVNWWYYNKLTGKYNLLIVKNKSTNELVGFYGVIPVSQFDQDLYGLKDIWISNFSVKESERGKGLGKSLIEFIDNNFEKRSMCALGISSMAFPLFIKLGYKTGYLNHYYILNSEMRSFSIAGDAEVVEKQESTPKLTQFTLKELETLQGLDIQTPDGYEPKKTVKFIEDRYLNHPVYNYRYFGVYDQDTNLKTILVIKHININESSCLRIVDMVGDFTSLGKVCFRSLLVNENVEYIDCLNFGIAEKVFLDAGFRIKTESPIIPEHFEPYEQKNIPINYAFKGENDYVMFKGDGSLDRPRTKASPAGFSMKDAAAIIGKP